MKIQTYRELESKDDLVPILDHAFNWVFNQEEFDKFVRIDPRVKDGPVGFCAVENGRIIGHVGVMDLKTRTIEGNVEFAGGLFGVATLPGKTRRGVCTALMKKAHECFEEKRYRFSFLSTSPALIAHSFYVNLGYIDLVEYPTAYKIFHKKVARRSEYSRLSGFDPERILRIYDEFTREKTGLVVRDKKYLNMLRKIEKIKPKQCLIDREGYVIFREDRTGTWIRELAALNMSEMHKLIGNLETRAKGPIFDRAVLDKKLLGVYEARGYLTLKNGYSVFMFKPLVESASFSQTYGENFFLTRLDSF